MIPTHPKYPEYSERKELPRICSSAGRSLRPKHDLHRPERGNLDEQSKRHFRGDKAVEMIDGARALYIKPRNIHGWGWDKMLRFYSNYINLGENKSFLSSHEQCGQFMQLKVIMLSLCVYFMWETVQLTMFHSICMDRCLWMTGI